ncbi:MAG: CotH kinase family protein [Clostridia bacterium]|nr:CotH kinase family protein [Clostridia bacterium]
MSTHKNIDRICLAIVAVTVAVALVFCGAAASGVITVAARVIGYETRLFDQSKVHTLDIVMDDWDEFIKSCANEEYGACAVVIDGEAYKNVAIRAKGNTSLSSVANLGSSRYSFKIEFDHYEDGKSYHGLDKLCLNNLIQDNTYMKDYLAYTLMAAFGADAPLCSFVYITVNGEDWGLYLAVEGIEESFLQRNYGNQYGELYKPDSLSFGGGRGNGKDFSMTDFINKNSEDSEDSEETSSESKNTKSFSKNSGKSRPQMPGNFNPFGTVSGSDMKGKNFGKMGFGMGSSDVKLQYSDDDLENYSNIFNNAKTDVTKADKKRLIASLQSLSEYSDIESVVNVDEVLRYFVVHNFLCNGDSYTGTMIHNYYLYEEDGQLSMIPWDYNLAYGTFSGNNATSSVNDPIDSPMSNNFSDRPMMNWILQSAEYTSQYHALFSEFINQFDFASLIESTYNMIAEYVQKDPTKFCTYEQFQSGVEAIKGFCELRAQSVRGQLSGSIPSTAEGQTADSSALIDASSLSLSDMGTMGSGGGGFGRFGRSGKGKTTADSNTDNSNAKTSPSPTPSESSASASGSSDRQPPEGFNGQVPGNFDGQFPGNFDGQFPGNFDGQMPGNFDGQMPRNTDGQDQSKIVSGSDASGFPFNQTGQQEGNQALLLLVSVTVLIGGLIFAIKFRERRP